jgi:hypothetical protein
LKHSESFVEIEPDLVRLWNRLNRNRLAAHLATRADNDDEDNTSFDEEEQAVKVVYVDNNCCCSVKNIVRRIFPDVLIKLDPFHWLKRWNKLVLLDASSAQAGIFRGLMSHAIFNVQLKLVSAASNNLRLTGTMR